MREIVIRLRGLSHAAKATLMACLLILFVLGGIGVNYLMSTAIINNSDVQQRAQIAQAKADENAAIKAAVAYSDRQWCGALTLLTSHPTPKPPDPAANPSRKGEYLFYEDLLQLEAQFGCGH